MTLDTLDVDGFFDHDIAQHSLGWSRTARRQPDALGSGQVDAMRLVSLCDVQLGTVGRIGHGIAGDHISIANADGVVVTRHNFVVASSGSQPRLDVQ